MLKSYKSSIYLVLLCVTLQSWALPQGSNYEPGRKPIPMHGRDDSNLRYSPTVPSTGTVPTGSGYIAPSSFPATSQAYSPTNITLSSHSAPTASFPTPSFPTPSSSNHSQPLPVNHGFLRGVNIGGWLVLEKWMNGDVFAGAASEAKDQFSFDSTPGAADSLERHWSTWFTESDVQTLQSYGINAYIPTP